MAKLKKDSRTTIIFGIILAVICTSPILLSYTPDALAESTSSGQWTRIAPAGCEVHAVAVDHQNEKTVFAGTRGGGSFKSTDVGRNWLAMGCRLPDDKVMAVAASPFDANLVVAGMERGGICRSGDDGTTWEKAAELKEKNGRVLAADPTNQDIVFIGTYMGSLYRSADGGMNWEKQLKGFEVQSVSAVATDPKSAGTVYAGTGYRGVLRKFES